MDVPTASMLVREALPAFGIAEAAPLVLMTQRENYVFAVRHELQDLIVRMHRQGYHSDTELASELRFVDVLREEGIPTPRFRRTQDGRPFCVVGQEHPAGRHQVDTQLAIANSGNLGDPPAGNPEAVQVDPTDFEQLGLLLARVHTATQRAGFCAETTRSSWDVEGLVGTNAIWGDPLRIPELTHPQRALLRRAIHYIRARLTAYGRASNRYGAIHADSSPANVLRTPHGLALIDFDDFGNGWHMFDLATSLYAFTPHSRFEQYRQALFTGYQSIRPLHDGDRAAFSALLVARGLTYLGWAADRRGEPAAEAQVTLKLPNLLRQARILIEQHGDAL